MNMQRAAQTMLYAHDLDETIRWYCVVLGFTLDGTWPDEKPTWCSINYGPARLMFTHNPDEGRHDARMSGELCFYPDDVNRYHDEVIARGAQPVHPLTDQAWGMRTFFLEDPNGYALMFAQGLDELA